MKASLQGRWPMSFKKRSTGFLFFLFIFINTLSAQKIVTGKVTAAADGKPLAEVNVIVKGTPVGTKTYPDGTYAIKVEKDVTLVFTYVGYEIQQIPAGDITELNVAMKQQSITLGDVVVVGFGKQKKISVTGAISSNNRNTREIESFSILKDASATAVYGVRGATGVILITTKRGKPGKPQVVFRTENAALTAMRLPDYINGYEYAGLINEALSNDNLPVRYTPEELQKFKDHTDPYLYPDVNWSDAVLKKNTFQRINNHFITAGNEVVKYYTNAGYTLLLENPRRH